MNIGTALLTEGGVAYVTANENFFRNDAFAQFSIKDRDLTAPPGSPAEGDRYLVKATGTGAWASHDAAVAIYHNSTWIFFTPQEGWRMWIDDEDVLLTYDGTNWGESGSILDRSGRIFKSTLSNNTIAGFATISGTAYFVYMGKLNRTAIMKYVRFYVRNAGVGAQTLEVGLYSTPSAPNHANQTLTKICATGTVDSITTTGGKSNTSSFAQSVTAGTHMWAAFRVAMATTQPAIFGLMGDYDLGRVLAAAGEAALTGTSTVNGVIITEAGAANCTDLHVSMD